MTFDIARLCKPAHVYFIIAVIIIIVSALLNINNLDIGGLISQFASIVICTMILMFLCNTIPTLAWVFTILFILSAISWAVGLIGNLVTRA